MSVSDRGQRASPGSLRAGVADRVLSLDQSVPRIAAQK
jgi:hypothetical protein